MDHTSYFEMSGFHTGFYCRNSGGKYASVPFYIPDGVGFLLGSEVFFANPKSDRCK
jgi:hypothetical protein